MVVLGEVPPISVVADIEAGETTVEDSLAVEVDGNNASPVTAAMGPDIDAAAAIEAPLVIIAVVLAEFVAVETSPDPDGVVVA